MRRPQSAARCRRRIIWRGDEGAEAAEAAGRVCIEGGSDTLPLRPRALIMMMTRPMTLLSEYECASPNTEATGAGSNEN